MATLSFLVFFYALISSSTTEPPAEVAPAIIAGTWKGVLTQDRGGYKPEYDFQLKLSVQDGHIVGSSYVSVNSIYANWKLQGALKDDVLYFRETTLGPHTQMDELYWCLKEGKLHLKMIDYQWVLYGSWSGNSDLGACVPGKIRLIKVVPQA